MKRAALGVAVIGAAILVASPFAVRAVGAAIEVALGTVLIAVMVACLWIGKRLGR